MRLKGDYSVGILDQFLNKPLSGKGKPGQTGNSPTFRGDLGRLLEESSGQGTDRIHPEPNKTVKVNTDSSEVYLSFQDAVRAGWICHECETWNSDSNHNCVVCGRSR